MEYIINLIKDLLMFTWDIAVFLIPIMVVIEIFKDLKITDKIAGFIKPATNFLSISEKSGISLVIGIFFGLTYGAGAMIQSAKDYNLDKRSIFIICIFLSLCHAIVEDTVLFSAIGANLSVIIFSRIVTAILVTIVFSKLKKQTNINEINTEEIAEEIDSHSHECVVNASAENK
jgi:hypothetical protein